VWLKICGVQVPETARWLANKQVDAVGLNRYPDSSRYVGDDRARTLSRAVKEESESVLTVGIYVNESPEAIRRDVEAFVLDAVQLHGDESPEIVQSLSDDVRVIKAFRVGPDFSEDTLDSYAPWAYLLDAYRSDRYGGTGETAPWERIQSWTTDRRVVLAGGLTPENVVDAYESVEPWGLDVNSGVEGPDGRKNRDEITRLLSKLERVR
jgi:phosphoribosylanthranilate isomerase